MVGTHLWWSSPRYKWTCRDILLTRHIYSTFFVRIRHIYSFIPYMLCINKVQYKSIRTYENCTVGGYTFLFGNPVSLSGRRACSSRPFLFRLFYPFSFKLVHKISIFSFLLIQSMIHLPDSFPRKQKRNNIYNFSRICTRTVRSSSGLQESNLKLAGFFFSLFFQDDH